jgi:hypothetical protein
MSLQRYDNSQRGERMKEEVIKIGALMVLNEAQSTQMNTRLLAFIWDEKGC